MIIKWIIDSHLWIALGAVGLTMFTLNVIGEESNTQFIALIFTATFFIYNLQSLLKWNRRYKDSAKRSVVGLKTTKIITIVSGIALLGLSFELKAKEIVLVGILGMTSLFYAAKINWSKKKKSDLRSIPFIKIYLIAAVWAGVCALLPIMHFNSELFDSDYFFVAAIFLYILGITVPFDIRDLKYDRKSLKTLPQIFGEKGSKFMAILILAGSVTIFTILFQRNYISPNLFSLAIAILSLSLILILLSNKDRSNHFYTGLIDGTMVLFLLSGLMN